MLAPLRKLFAPPVVPS